MSSGEPGPLARRALPLTRTMGFLASSRTAEAYFQAGGTLADIPEAERNFSICMAAIAHTPRALRDVPSALRSSPRLCREAVRRDGYALESVPPALLAEGSEHRRALCDLAYASPRPPRMRHVPEDLLTEDRCLRSLRWAPRDLDDIPEHLLSSRICLSWVQHIPAEFDPLIDEIPERLRDDQIGIALLSLYGRSEVVFKGEIEAWVTPQVCTPAFIRQYFLTFPDELFHKHKFKDPVSLPLLAEILQKNPDGLHAFGSTRAIAQFLLATAAAAGYRAGDALPAIPRDRSLLPKDLGQRELMRWAVLYSPRPSLDDVPHELRADPEVGAQILRRGALQEVSRLEPGFVARNTDLLAQRAHQDPQVLLQMDPGVCKHLDPRWLDSVSAELLAQNPASPLLDHLFRHATGWRPGRLHDMMKRLEPRLDARAKADLLPLQEVPAGERTRSRCEQAVARNGSDYRHVPPAHRDWPMLRAALQEEPDLLRELPAQEVTEALCLRAMVEVGISPAHVPDTIRDRPSFRTALGQLPPCVYNPKALFACFDDAHGEPGPDELTLPWIERLLQEEPRRVLDMGRWFKPEWALMAYRLGTTLEHINSNLECEHYPDFLAEFGPYTATMDGPLNPPQRTGAPGVPGNFDGSVRGLSFSSSSSSSSAAASARRPS